MARPSYPFSIVGPQFCAPNHSIDLAITKAKGGKFAVTDTSGAVFFKVTEVYWSSHCRRRLLDAAGNTLLTLRRKRMSSNDSWQVFRGDSKDPNYLLFSVKGPKMFQRKTKLRVFLPNNKKKEVCDFKVKGSWSKKSCAVCAGESSSVVAQMHKKQKNIVQNIPFKKIKFMVNVYPGMDFAFIVALIGILDGINGRRDGGDIDCSCFGDCGDGGGDGGGCGGGNCGGGGGCGGGGTGGCGGGGGGGGGGG